jgi:acetylornithine deacetylase/succinyl-diaminopimelate desuccinylase-like protein
VVAYCAEYGDKTVEGVGDGVLNRHVGWMDCGPESARLEVYGLAGHMGAAARLDGAITKAAFITQRLVHLRGERGEAWSHLALELDAPPENPLVLEGGQGFLPTHDLGAVCERMRRAADRGLNEYRRAAHLEPGAITVTVGFDKLHNAAYESRADGPALEALTDAAVAAGIEEDMQVTGWKASCDARIFAREFPKAEVLTFGPGLLSLAHSGDEHAELTDILAAAETLARMALAYGREE